MLSRHSVSLSGDVLSQPHWYALHTRARAEKKVEAHLAGAGVEAFAALAEVERRWSDRRKRVTMPLFPGYVFARFALPELSRVLGTVGVAGVVRSEGVPARIRDQEIGSVRTLVRGVTETGATPEPADYLEPGEPVQVTEGPFRGMEGVLLEVRGKGRVAVRLSRLRQAVGVELPLGILRPRRKTNTFRDERVAGRTN